MSHDIEASWAGAEVADAFSATPGLCFASAPSPSNVSTYAGREGKSSWPHADGLIEITVTGNGGTYNVALEYKRLNEGLHGILTAFGQAHAYLRKGYAGSVIVLPKRYPGLSDVGAYARDVLDNTSKADSIGVFVYEAPDRNKVSPFEGKLSSARPLVLDSVPSTTAATPKLKPKTQWVHVREGSSEPDAYYRYLQAVKLVSGDDFSKAPFNPPRALLGAVAQLQPGVNPSWYLSFTSGDTTHDRAWRYFWFKNVLAKKMMKGWSVDPAGTFHVNHVLSNILRSDGTGNKNFFSGKSNSKKNKIVVKLNAGTISQDKAWQDLAKNFHERAHSYREDIDSGLEKIGYIDQDGRLTDEGYRFLDACEKGSDPNSGVPKALLARALLDKGGLGTFLHYVHKLSDEIFSSDPLKFSTPASSRSSSSLAFDQSSYLAWLEDNLANRLHVLRKVSLRGGTQRKPFQAELAVLRSLGLVMPGFRIGVGLPINWPEVQKVQEN